MIDEPTRWLRVVALSEAVTYLVLLAATVIKYTLGFPQGTSVIGPIHGIVFLAYVGLVVLARDERHWSLGRTALAILAAVVPLGGYLVERRLLTYPAPAR